jgi:OOP family OmpA-OmpF porin
MAASILETLTRSLGPSVLSKASATYGESDSAVNKGFTAAIAAVLAPIVARAGDANFTRDLFGALKDAPTDVALLDEPDRAFSRPVPALDNGGPMARMQSLLFGGNSQSITSAIASATGLRATTASSLVALAVPTVIGYLSRLVKRENLDPASLGRRLAAERAPISAVLPASLGSLLTGGAGALDDVARAGTRAAAAGRETFDRAAAAAAVPAQKTGTWIAVALFGLLALGALYALMGRGRGIEGTPGAVGTVGYLSRSLPNGTNLRFPATSTEARLLAFLEKNTLVDQDTWYEFDRVAFETDSATLRPQSREQLANIAAIMNAYPDVRVKIGGYTDNTGDASANLRLSQSRAESVMNELRNDGIDTSRLEAEGYGNQHPVADNATAEGRARNRRVALRVTAR